MFEWDEAKNVSNIAKHGIDFADARRIFTGPIVTRIDDRFEYGETRMLSIGTVEGRAFLVVVHTTRGETTRIISARLANRAERLEYEKQTRSTDDSR